MDQVSVTLLGTAVIVALGVLFSNSRISDLNSRLSDTNARIDAMQQNTGLGLQSIASVIHAESAKLQAGIERVEGVLDARLRHVEEKLGITAKESGPWLRLSNRPNWLRTCNIRRPMRGFD